VIERGLRHRFRSFVGRTSAGLFGLGVRITLLALSVFVAAPIGVCVQLLSAATRPHQSLLPRISFGLLGGLLLALVLALIVGYLVTLISILKERKAHGADGRHHRRAD
jgi:hypothetical protein